MSKFTLLFFIAFLAIGVAVAQGPGGCKPPGFICSSDSDCCPPFACNPWAGRCTKKISPVGPGSVGKTVGAEEQL